MAAEESTPTPTSTSAPNVEQRHAPLRARVAAALVDGVVLVVVCAFLPQPFPPVLPLVLLVCYQTLTTWWLRASVGKALLGLRVVRLEGEVTLAWALLRAGPGYLVLTALGLGWALAAVPPDRRPLHDRVLGADVIVVEASVRSLHQAGARLAHWARQRDSVAERKRGRTAAALAMLWAWLAGLGTAVQRFVDWLRGADTTGPSAVSSLSTSAAATISGVAAAGIAVLLAPVPPLANAADWLVQPRYWATSPTSVASTPPTGEPHSDDRAHGLAGWWASEPSLSPFSQVMIEFVPRSTSISSQWDVILRAGPDECTSELGQVVARVEHVTSIDGRPLHERSHLQVTESNSECSSLFVTDRVYADEQWPVELTVLDSRMVGHAYTTLSLEADTLTHGVSDADLRELIDPAEAGPEGQLGQVFARTTPP